MGRLTLVFFLCGMLISARSAAQLRLRPLADTSEKQIDLKVLPRNFYSQHLGYFCKKEVQLQRSLSLPLFIRLGSKEYVDYMEGKLNAVYKK